MYNSRSSAAAAASVCFVCQMLRTPPWNRCQKPSTLSPCAGRYLARRASPLNTSDSMARGAFSWMVDTGAAARDSDRADNSYSSIGPSVLGVRGVAAAMCYSIAT